MSGESSLGRVLRRLGSPVAPRALVDLTGDPSHDVDRWKRHIYEQVLSDPEEARTWAKVSAGWSEVGGAQFSAGKSGVGGVVGGSRSVLGVVGTEVMAEDDVGWGKGQCATYNTIIMSGFGSFRTLLEENKFLSTSQSWAKASQHPPNPHTQTQRKGWSLE